MKKIFTLLEKRSAGLLILFISITCRIISVFLSSYAGGDKMFLALQSKNLLAGRGLCIPRYFIAANETPFYDYTPMWPPGYPILLAPFLKLFNYNVNDATTALDLVICISFIFLVRKICQQINLPAAATNLMTLAAGCFEFPFVVDSLPTDLISLLFFLLGISFALKVVSAANLSRRHLFFTGFFLFLPCIFRYAYPPLSIAVPLVIVLCGWQLKNKQLVRKGIWITCITLLLISALFVILKLNTGSATYVTLTERGYYPENIINWYPFIPASFIDLPFLSSQFIKYTGWPIRKFLEILEVINIIILLALVVLFIINLFIKKTFRSLTPFKWMILWGIVCSGLIFLMLGYLSFTYDVQRGFTNSWNYVYEARYYAFVTLFIQLLFAGWVFLHNGWKNSLWQKIIIGACALFLFIEVSHNIYFYTKVAFNFSKYKSAIFWERDYRYFKTLMADLEKEYPEHDFIVAAPNDNCYMYFALYDGKKGIFDSAKLKNATISVKSKTIFVLMLLSQEVHEYKDFLTSSKARLIHQVNYANFYVAELLP